jgi:short-subunit dehydrogenase
MNSFIITTMKAQNIVITGGTSGLGKAMTHEFCRRNHNVLIAGRNNQTLIETRRDIHYQTIGKCFVQQCDVIQKDDLTQLADYAQDLFKGKIDHWINNAGVCEGPEDFTNITLDAIENVINTNLLAVMMGTKIATNIRVKNIYAISGHGSSFTRTPEFAVYGSSKAGISHFYSTIIEETNSKGSKGSQGNSSYHIIAPGIMKTPLTDKLLNHSNLNTVTKFIIDQVAMEPEDVASKIVPKLITISGNGNVVRPIF